MNPKRARDAAHSAAVPVKYKNKRRECLCFFGSPNERVTPSTSQVCDSNSAAEQLPATHSIKMICFIFTERIYSSKLVLKMKFVP